MTSVQGVQSFSNMVHAKQHATAYQAMNQPTFLGENDQSDTANAKKQYDQYVKKRIFIDVGIGAAAVVAVWTLLDYFGKKACYIK